ncbi:MAG: hypothetical protein JF616_21955 [Fibrobacteres bacterium]|jgi:hypothetical protein|nr:hypothetical protein [Fibrobacterota bacterium]
MPILPKQITVRVPGTLILALTAFLAARAGAAEPVSPDSGTAKVLENILSKEGISVGGAFRSQYLHSSIEGPGSIPSLRSEEGVEYTSVDFDIRARPNSATEGHLIMRMHQDWRNFFSDIGNPINTRWLSIDGNVKGMFTYSAGDFLRKYSPLTLWAPSPEVEYEPALFAGDRREAMDEVFLQDNKRLMQGVDLAFDASVDNSDRALLKEFHYDVLGSRLRNVETNIGNGDKPTDFIERALSEKYLAASNLDLASPLGISLGASYLLIFDKKGSFAAPTADTAAQHTSIASGRAGYDLASLLGTKDWDVSLSAEFAKSTDDTDFYATKTATGVTHNQIVGNALLARLQGNWSAGKAFALKAGVNYVSNDAGYRNELAQSPTFVGERVLNIDNDTTRVRINDPRARNYSTFDALYDHVYKFVPGVATNLWARAPFQKNSWNSSIMTQGEMAAFAASRIDTAVQLVMPFGQATPNRKGIQSDLTADAMNGNIEVQGSYAALENATGVMVDTVRSLPVTKFTQAGGGLKVEAGGLMGLSLPLTLAGSFMRSTADNDGIAGDTLHALTKVTSDFINAGAQWNFWKRFTVLGGWQQITTTVDRAATEAKQVQTHTAGGIDYKVAAGAHLLFTVGQIKVDEPTPAAGGDHDFSQLLTDVFMTVHF